MKKINPINNNGSIQIRFNLKGVTYICSPIPGSEFSNEADLEAVRAICNQIALDIRSGIFDATDRKLEKYCRAKKTKFVKGKLIDLYEVWLNSLDKSDYTKAGIYTKIKKQILKSDPAINETDWLCKSNISASTFNGRLSIIKKCYEWAFNKGYIQQNIWLDISPRKVKKTPVMPFTKDERNKILRVFEEKKPHYLGFVKFLFITGCRFNEATGLKWSMVDFEEGHILIRESLSKDPRGTYRKIQKERKNAGSITFPMTDQLREILENQPRINEYVFLTVRKKNIDAVAFRNQYWEKYLEIAGVPFRSYHKIRHTFVTQGAKDGIPITDLAYLIGDNVGTTIRSYTHFIGIPKVPNIL